ncbi:Transposable element tcb2 transposase [Caligus rogercresseyi]|uniref:Transposable element tcb2 transposase n=1 Tax=Caligus rogercresseyi TaxID=217165 RepID=A0A7T8K0S7_CALRO|nr:Transposable element tcb2 transposase [Caligus rogercresseyi]
MVLGVICSNGSVMPQHFFGPKEKVNTEVYLNVFKTVVVPWMGSVASGIPYTFQQDSAPAHKAKLV